MRIMDIWHLKKNPQNEVSYKILHKSTIPIPQNEVYTVYLQKSGWLRINYIIPYLYSIYRFWTCISLPLWNPLSHFPAPFCTGSCRFFGGYDFPDAVAPRLGGTQQHADAHLRRNDFLQPAAIRASLTDQQPQFWVTNLPKNTGSHCTLVVKLTARPWK